jgi:cyclopropane-fatty-acyl-phospholipid synthase
MAKTFHPDGYCVYSGPWWWLAIPAVTLAAYLGVAIAGAFVALRLSGGPALPLVAGLPAGFAIWTLFEYVLHRWLLHETRRPILRDFFWDGFHREHHRYRRMEDPDPHTVHLAITLPIALGLLAAAALATRSGLAVALVTGWLAGYGAYELFHWIFHSEALTRRTSSVAWIRRLRDAHFVHHFERANRNFGFLTPFWDRVFGTYAAPHRVNTNSTSCSPGGIRTAR